MQEDKKENKLKGNLDTFEEEKKQKVKLKFKKKTLMLGDKPNSQPEYDQIKKMLTSIYGDSLKVDKTLVLKCLSLSCSQENEKIHLPYNVHVDKKGKELIFSTPNLANPFLILLFINILTFVTIAASYSAVDFLSKADLNKDIDGDGIPDINLDLNEDDVAEINISVDGNNVPDINIDYKGNKKSVFNIDTNDDNKADSNLVTTVEGKICKKNQINCDINGDGWPDVNIDIDGDGKADVDMDANEDGVLDLNIDTNRDGICDVNCDNNDDWVCDYNCVTQKETITIIEKVKPSGASQTTGNPNTRNETQGDVEVVFTDTQELVATGIYPDDQPGMEPIIPEKTFTVENKTSYIQYYDIKWEVYSNTFDENRNNMKFMVTGTNGGGNLEWTTVPRMGDTAPFLTRVAIGPRVKQSYTVYLKLQGVNGPQNYDKGKTFSAKLQVQISETSSQN